LNAQAEFVHIRSRDDKYPTAVARTNQDRNDAASTRGAAWCQAAASEASSFVLPAFRLRLGAHDRCRGDDFKTIRECHLGGKGLRHAPDRLRLKGPRERQPLEILARRLATNGRPDWFAGQDRVVAILVTFAREMNPCKLLTSYLEVKVCPPVAAAGPRFFSPRVDAFFYLAGAPLYVEMMAKGKCKYIQGQPLVV
jgi:hypothetical protein